MLGAVVHDAGLEARNQQQGVERFDEVVGLLDRAFQALAIGFRAARIAQRRLGPVAQTVERGFQVVRDVVGDLAKPVHELLDAVEHGIEGSPRGRRARRWSRARGRAAKDPRP